jgi:hypothetical protein
MDLLCWTLELHETSCVCTIYSFEEMTSHQVCRLRRPSLPLRRLTLPTSLEAQYQVYHNLETAEARLLLPLKVGHFPVLRRDVAASHESAEADLLPACVGVGEVPSNSLQCVCHDVSRSCYMMQCAAVQYPHSFLLCCG